MGLISRARRKLAGVVLGRDLTTVEQYLDRIANGKGSAGVSVTEDNALNLSAVFSCVRVLSESVAQLPVGYYRKEDRGSQREPGRLDDLVAKEFNPRMDSFTFRETLTRHAALRGNGLAHIIRDERGGVSALYPIHPDRLKEIRVDPQGRGVFYNIEGFKSDLPEEDVFHLKTMSPDGYRGQSVLNAAEKEFATGIATQEFSNSFWENSAAPGLVVKVPEELSQENYDRLKESLDEFREDKAGGALPLDGGTEIETAGIPQRDAQFLETQRFSKEQIASIFRVPPPLLMDLTNANYSNVTALYQMFVKSSLLPWLKRWEHELDRKIKPGSRDAKNNFFRYDVDDLLRGNATERANFYRVMLREGVLTRNEVRERENLNPVSEDEADKLFKQIQDVPLGTPPKQ